jgi:hypothetical protein
MRQITVKTPCLYTAKIDILTSNQANLWQEPLELKGTERLLKELFSN